MKKEIISKIFFLAVFFIGVSSNAQVKKWTLEECVLYALENNISIKQSQLDLKTSDVERLEAVGNFLPAISANANYSMNTGANINPATNQFNNETFKSFSAQANGGVTLFNGLLNWRTYQRTKLNKVANTYRLDKMKDDIMLSVANNFLEILSLKEQLRVLQNQNRITKENLDRTKALIDAGSLPAGDIYELRATDAGQEQQIINAQNNLLISKVALCQMLLLEDYVNFDIADQEFNAELSSVLEENPQSIFVKAKQTVNDIKVAAQDVEVAKKDVQIAKSAYLPTLSGFVGYNARWSESTPLPFSDQIYLFDGTSIGLQLSVPILNGFSTRTRVQRSQISQERSQYLLKQAELDLETNVYKAYNDVVNSKKLYEAAQKTSEARKFSYEFSKERFDVGLQNSFDFSQSSIAYENAQSEEVRAKYDYIFKTKILEFYFGMPIIQKQ
ncbi:TolC family protein [Flavobacterium macacae]|uniref:TolC family protein n=1 Tax=Flavobacterium macacae TaxID=2488993 RepID=A0A3P3WCP5_9FLAO|nr:TolC family protein [Flavobacterium macacae]RRJ91806.1 TolC family protein [Flavobacterium macacae]